MLNEVRQLIESNPDYRILLKAILNNPYIEKQILMKKVGLCGEIFETLLKTSEDKLIVLELASQAEHSIESRVPKKVYVINPEVEQDIQDILGES